MELGLMVSAGDVERHPEECEELGLRWFGVGACHPRENGSLKVIQADIDKTIQAGGVPIGKWVGDLAMLAKPEIMLDTVEKDFACLAKDTNLEYIEVWPEPCSLYITQGKLNLPMYVRILKAAYEGAKAVRPEMQIWNGGIGQFRTMWGIQDFFSEGLNYVDAFNLNPFQFADTWQVASYKIGHLLAQSRLLMERKGFKKDIVSTEWAYPTSESQQRFESYLDPRGISGFREEAHAVIVSEVLWSFYDMNSPLLCFAFLQDAGGPHWGGHTGLLRMDSSRKPAYEVVKEWMKKQREER